MARADVSTSVFSRLHRRRKKDGPREHFASCRAMWPHGAIRRFLAARTTAFPNTPAFHYVRLELARRLLTRQVYHGQARRLRPTHVRMCAGGPRIFLLIHSILPLCCLSSLPLCCVSFSPLCCLSDAVVRSKDPRDVLGAQQGRGGLGGCVYSMFRWSRECVPLWF